MKFVIIGNKAETSSAIDMNDTYGGKIAFLIVSLGFLESSSALLLGGVLGSDVLLQVIMAMIWHWETLWKVAKL